MTIPFNINLFTLLYVVLEDSRWKSLKGFPYQTCLAKPARADYDQMVSAVQNIADI